MKTGRGKDLPEELVEEILSKLPVKSVLRFKCVSKSWQSLIGSKHLIKTHLRNSTNNTAFPNHRVIFLQHSTESGYYIPKQYNNLQSLLNDPFMDPSPMANVPTINKPYGSIVGCCNGLVCILGKSRHVMLWNPATRISKKLPIIHIGEKLDLLCVRLGFGWDESSGAYKVFAMVILYDPDVHPHSRLCYSYKVYSSKTNSWKTLELPHSFLPDPIYGHGQFVCGKIHWPEFGGGNIVFFDLKSEECGMMEAPPGKPEPRSQFCVSLGEIRGCLGAVYDHRNSNSTLMVWVMKELSWEKLATIPLVADSHQPGNYNPFTILFKGGVDGELLLMNRDTLCVRFSFEGSHDASVYVESLVSPHFH